MIEVQLYTKPGCHLCDQMKQALEEASNGLEIRLEEIDISQDDELMELYGWDIPVLFINGTKAAKHRITAKELRKRLTRRH